MGLNLGPPPAMDVLEVTDEAGKRVALTGIGLLIARFRQAWLEWFKNIGIVVVDVQNSGTTAQRPTDNLYVGKPYFDTVLGYEIHYNGAAWVNSAGAPV